MSNFRRSNTLTIWRPARNTITCMDALQFLWQLEDESVHCVVTSPPYYGLRDYNVAGQLGLEDTPQAYIERMVAVFREVRRVLRSDGVAFVNMGDSYATGGSGAVSNSNHDGKIWRDEGRKDAFRNSAKYQGQPRQNTIGNGFKPKDLMMMPARLAIALQADGWFVRADIVWHKPNPMPESVTDRPTSAHEYVFMLTKSAKYWADMDAVRESSTLDMQHRALAGHTRGGQVNGKDASRNDRESLINAKAIEGTGRNLRSVWTIATQPTSLAHFATFPQALVERCVKMGAPARTCAECGAGWVRVVEVDYKHINFTQPRKHSSYVATSRGAVANKIVTTKGFRPSCECGSDETRPGLVLDIFMGSGTTAIVARRLGRDYIGCDLSQEYVDLANGRLRDSDPFQPREVAGVGTQLSLFADTP